MQTVVHVEATNPYFNAANASCYPNLVSDISHISQYGMTQLSDRCRRRILKRGLHICLHFKTMQHVLEMLRRGDKKKRKGQAPPRMKNCFLSQTLSTYLYWDLLQHPDFRLPCIWLLHLEGWATGNVPGPKTTLRNKKLWAATDCYWWFSGCLCHTDILDTWEAGYTKVAGCGIDFSARSSCFGSICHFNWP